MFSIKVKTKEKHPNYSHDLETVIKELTTKKVVAGFPKGELNAPHYEYKWAHRMIKNKPPYPSIIDVAIWNNFGIGVPRREFMAEAAKKWQKSWEEKFEKVQEGMEKGHMDVEKFLDTMGIEGAHLISNTIRDWSVPPNSPYTQIMKGTEKNPVNNPLVDSGDMKNAPRHEIRSVSK